MIKKAIIGRQTTGQQTKEGEEIVVKSTGIVYRQPEEMILSVNLLVLPW